MNKTVAFSTVLAPIDDSLSTNQCTVLRVAPPTSLTAFRWDGGFSADYFGSFFRL